MGATAIPAHLNTTVCHTWQELLVCPANQAYETHHNHIHPQFIPVSWRAKGYTLHEGQRVALRNERVRLVGRNLVVKPEGQTRTILSLRDYRFTGQFDRSAVQVMVGERAPCAPYPAQRTAGLVRIPEGTFPLADLEFKQLD